MIIETIIVAALAAEPPSHRCTTDTECEAICLTDEECANLNRVWYLEQEIRHEPD